MKNIIAFVAFWLLLTSSAFAQKGKVSSKNDLKCIECSAGTRGYQEQIKIEETKITVHRTVRGVDEDKVIPITKKEWATWKKQVKTIQLANIAKLKAPSEAFKYDGDMACGITIETQKGKFQSVGFDKGNPPTELKSLMKKIAKL